MTGGTKEPLTTVSTKATGETINPKLLTSTYKCSCELNLAFLIPFHC